MNAPLAHALHDSAALGLHPAMLAVAVVGILTVAVVLPRRAEEPQVALPGPPTDGTGDAVGARPAGGAGAVPPEPAAADASAPTSVPPEEHAGERSATPGRSTGRTLAAGVLVAGALAAGVVGLVGPQGPNLASLMVANVVLPAVVLLGLLGVRPRPSGTWSGTHPLTGVLLVPVALTHAIGNAGSAVAGMTVLGYLGVSLVGRVRTGPGWWAHGDPLGVLLGLVARLAPWAPTGDGHRPWLHALWQPVTGPQRWVLGVVLAAAIARAARFLPAWVEVVGGRPAVVRTLAAAVLVSYVLALLVLLERTVRRLHGGTLGAAAIALAAAVVLANDAAPAAFSLHLAGTLISDPLGTGADLFGTADRTVSTALLASPAVWLFQLVVVLIGGSLAAAVQRDLDRHRGTTAVGPAVAVAVVTGVVATLLLAG